MQNKPTIKIKTVDVFNGFNPHFHYIYQMLSNHYNLVECDEPDFLICSCFNGEYLKYKNCVKIFFTDENVIPNFNEYDYAIGYD